MIGPPQLVHRLVREAEDALSELQAEEVKGEILMADGGLDEGDVEQDVGLAVEDGEGACCRGGWLGLPQDPKVVESMTQKTDDVADDGNGKVGLEEWWFSGVHGW